MSIKSMFGVKSHRDTGAEASFRLWKRLSGLMKDPNSSPESIKNTVQLIGARLIQGAQDENQTQAVLSGLHKAIGDVPETEDLIRVLDANKNDYGVQPVVKSYYITLQRFLDSNPTAKPGDLPNEFALKNQHGNPVTVQRRGSLANEIKVSWTPHGIQRDSGDVSFYVPEDTRLGQRLAALTDSVAQQVA